MNETVATMDEVEKVPVLRITNEGREEIDDLIVRESPFTISLDNQELVTMLCSPTNLKYLAVGFLFSEGLLKEKDEIRKVVVDDRRGMAWIETKEDRVIDRELLSKRLVTSGCGRGASFYTVGDLKDQEKVESDIRVSPQEIFALVNEFQHNSEVYKNTHGVHSAALCDRESILLFSEDIGRHNAVDKVIGESILKDIPTDDKMIIISGRISSEMLLKAAKIRIPVVISIAAPTNLGVKVASDLGITLVGFVRPKRMTVYSGSWRIAG
ncbi:formate dehydrogenase accessory sulfurtransferase FdhD [Chloroflexota bacterium]